MSRPILAVRFAFGSLRYALVDVDTRADIAHGQATGIGEEVGEILHEVGGHAFETRCPLPDDKAALKAALEILRTHSPGAEITAVAHRVLHGADVFSSATFVDDDVIAAVEKLAPLAPEHNPDAAVGMRVARRILPDIPHVAVFDTAFFHSLPPAASTYALPTSLTEQLGIRKYGFHGPTHSYVSQRVSLLLGNDDLRHIVCFLGHGCSISAISAGQPVDVSSGFTTLGGQPTRFRSGTIDPGIHQYVATQTGMSLAEFDRILKEESGLFGLSGQTSLREIWAAKDRGDARASLAIDVCVHRIVSYIASFHAVLGGAQAISFTGSAGENDARLRQAICDRLACIGVQCDREENAKAPHGERLRIISAAHSAIVLLVVGHREALAMARETADTLGWHH
ncbi:MAG: acetate/propionate family kinase [Micrococcales bacterium]|nr:acetate/propionate family kinase [Micrococcales bacterium]